MVQQIRTGRMTQAKELADYIANVKEYLIRVVTLLSLKDRKMCSRIAPDYRVGKIVLLLFFPQSSELSEDRTEVTRLVVLKPSQQVFLHNCHSSFEGVHQKIR